MTYLPNGTRVLVTRPEGKRVEAIIEGEITQAGADGERVTVGYSYWVEKEFDRTGPDAPIHRAAPHEVEKIPVWGID